MHEHARYTRHATLSPPAAHAPSRPNAHLTHRRRPTTRKRELDVYHSISASTPPNRLTDHHPHPRDQGRPDPTLTHRSRIGV
eukprot:1000105-Prymnesium_polylepis.1